ncbi:barstar family protein [Streptomyces sp. 15-116A]|uniref:barstar family protein n=1 Tax=Streptomyces sp. 15-116A TaxID=2259035 RepID=UPI0021B15C6D|nr:barstar family protein [Streptomyces sp. 15-116A]MCT7356504.1 barstar family protein [Streptomyces sp. 15-116A]
MADETNDTEPAVPESVVIDLATVRNAEELHRLLQRRLQFPDFYGRNWNAFWDAITGLVDLPHELIFTGWSAFSAALPAEAHKLRALLDDYLGEYGQYFAVPRRIHYR